MGQLKTSVRRFGGVPTIHVNGVPVTGLMHWNRNMDAEDVRNFAEAGVRIFSFIGNLDPEDGSPVHDGIRTGFRTMTPAFIRSVMETILNACPDALVIPRFRLQASDGWKTRHPGSLMRYYDLETHAFEDGDMVTLGDEEWISDALHSLSRSVRFCEQHWGDHIAGYHSGFGQCAEHVWYWGAKIADYHPSMLPPFRRWLTGLYKNDAALRHAWNDPGASLEHAEVPAPERFTNFNPSASSLLNPATEQALIDYLQFRSEYMAELVVRQAKCVKKTLHELGSEKIFGAFYCYANLPANSISHYAVGQDAHQIVLDCPDVDYLSAPVGYSARQPGGVSTAQILPASAELAGKLYFAEDDTGTHRSVTRHNVLPARAEQSVQMMTRGFLDVWRCGGTQWFMDLFGEGVFRDPALMENVRKLADFAGRHMTDRESTAQIAVFLSDRSLSASKTFQFLTGGLIEQQLNEIAAIGSGFDVFRMEDLPELVRQDRLRRYRFAIVLNAHLLEDGLREVIEHDLKKDGRTILWFHAPGIIRNGKFDPEGCNALTGIRCVMAEGQRSSLMTEVLIDGERFCYGTPRNVNPRLYGADPEARSLGWIVEGTWTPFRQGANGAMLMEKEFPEWKSIWSSSPNMPSGLLARFAARSGVHLYSRRGDPVYSSKNWLAVHSKWDGVLELRLPEAGSWNDAWTGVRRIEQSDCLRMETRRGENIVLERVR